ncbi:Flp family type IVb pilin [Sulfitobacter sp.]|uniref:Flp family type IVb pilin n=1 Tax=Sulfitobacter sp. TaxID=1903071 RepID=UPI003030AF98
MTLTRTVLKAFGKTFIKNEDGATAIEYALMAALVGGVIVASVTTLGESADTKFGSLATTLDEAGGDTGSTGGEGGV